MELIYTTRTTGFEPGKKYRNPRFFAGPERAAKSVVIEGDWPQVKAAYEKREVDVKVVERGKPAKAEDGKPQGDETPDADREELVKAYEEKFGKAPAGNMKTENIRKKLDEAQS